MSGATLQPRLWLYFAVQKCAISHMSDDLLRYIDALTKIPDRRKLFKKTNLFGLRIDLRVFNELWGCMPQSDLPSLRVCNVHSNSVSHRNFYSKFGISETLPV